MGGLFSTEVVRRTELSATTKLSAEHETPPIANVLLSVRASRFIPVTDFLFKDFVGIESIFCFCSYQVSFIRVI